MTVTAPSLPAYREHGRHFDTLRVWCQHERRWHSHGADGGHRVAHCTCDGSRYRHGG